MVNFRSVIFLTLAASYSYAHDGHDDAKFDELLKSQVIHATIKSINKTLGDDIQKTSTNDVKAFFTEIFSRSEIKDNLIPKITVSDDKLDFCDIVETASKSLKDIKAAKDFDKLKKLFPSADNFDFSTVSSDLQDDNKFNKYKTNIATAKSKCPDNLNGSLKDLKDFLNAFKSSNSSANKQTPDGKKDEDSKKKEEPKKTSGACSYGIHLVSVMSICALLTIL